MDYSTQKSVPESTLGPEMAYVSQLKGASDSDLALLETMQYVRLGQSSEKLVEESEKQRKAVEWETRVKIAISAILGFLVLTIILWFVYQLVKILGKYRQMIELLREIIRLGYFSLTSAEVMAWCAEFPNFTGLLFSKIINRNFPKAVALAFYTPPYSNYFSLANPQESAIYLAKMEEYSNFNSDASAQEIICGAWGFGVGIDDCIDDCPIPHVPSTGEIASEAVYGAAMGLFLGSSIFFMATGGTAAILLLAAGAIGLATGVTRGVLGKNKAVEQCENLEQANCRVDVEQQCR